MTSLEVETYLVHEKKKLLQCDKCKKKFISEKRLKWHLATIHERKKPYQCIHCQKNFSLNQSLKKHIISAHDGGPFDCPECVNSFASKALFKTHYLAHLYDKHFNDLPDEVVLKILTYLDFNNLANCTQVSKRMRNICKDESLWERINVKAKFGQKINGIFPKNIKAFQKIPTSFINYILDNGCRYLNICKAELVDDVKMPKTSQLRYLALDELVMDHGKRTIKAVEEITSTCCCLEKFSIAWQESDLHFMENVIKNVCLKNSKTLTVLNLQMLNITFEHVKSIVGCTELKELSLSPNIHRFKDSYTSEKSLRYLVQNISPEIKKVSLESKRNFKNEHVKMLVIRCKKLEELSLKNTSITIVSVTAIAENCFNLVKLDLSNFGFNDHTKEEAQKRLRSLPKLTFFKMYDLEFYEPPSLCIAEPYEIESAEEGLWEIKAKPFVFTKPYLANINSDSDSDSNSALEFDDDFPDISRYYASRY